MKFSYSGDHLIIGFSDGMLIFLDSKISFPKQQKLDEKYYSTNFGKTRK